ncbi:response regulator [Glaciecola sp. XM2]|uniref:hybrid sensor histidine kinase/response regulator n=1 Tax=Glaciecola sp. XM2 TaxID=1914931 RepID=UPI001BDE5DA9|nr:hybrid sensor histidine kinase/response regulator [Glaciecola sp. XM2]MBT1451621.1 response regulator [Glaciecola sp. XM2]
MNKVFHIFGVFGLLTLLFTSKAFANGPFEIKQSAEPVLLTPIFKVYESTPSELSFEDFRKQRAQLAYTKSDGSNFGLFENGLWFYGELKNTSELEQWILSIRFSQLNNVQLYLLRQGEIIFAGNDGGDNKQSSYAFPTFNLSLPQGETLEVYLYIEASSLSLLAPIHLYTPQQHTSTDQADFLLWGGFYGLILILFFYALSFTINYPRLSNFLFFGHVALIFAWQVTWSGHNYLIQPDAAAFFSLLLPEELILLLCISSSVFTFSILPISQLANTLLRAYLFFFATCFTTFIAMLLPIWSVEWRLDLMYLFSFACLFINIYATFYAYKHDFKPARPILIGWLTMLIGTVLSVMYIIGYLPTNTFNSQLFQLALSLQAGAFLLSIVSRTQYELETDLLQARADAENNFITVEEQNVVLNIARRDAIKASEIKSQFLANMSHEIRTPLNAIIGFSKELESGSNVEERDEHVKIINSAATDLLTLVNDILDFSKMEAGQLTLNNKTFKPKELFEDIAATMSKTAHLKQLEFVYDIDPLPDYLLGDIFRLKQLITNLISNALKFTNYGHIALRAKLLEQDGEKCLIQITVEDSGIGISNDEIDNIFKAFHQLDDELNRSYQGTGLGLVICQEIVYLMNGEIRVTSQPQVGSTFTSTIPFKIQHRQDNLLPQQPFKGKHAIVYDKWGESRRSIVKQLQIMGFTVSSFETLELARKYIQPDMYLFVVLALKNASKRPQVISRLSGIAPVNTVILFSGAPLPTPLLSSMPASMKTIRLPLTARKLAALNAPNASPQDSQVQRQIKQLPRVRVLAVDDMKLNLRLLETWLKNSPITLDLAFDGPSAISKCEQVAYDLILMDIQMPNMDGIEATKNIRKTKLNFGTPIIAVSAHALEQEKQHFLQSGLEDFLSKPIKMERLFELINEWCELSETDTVKLPESIDWELALSRSNHNVELAMSFMNEFVEQLPEHLNAIEAAFKDDDDTALLGSVHKLHGACCYTGVPRLQAMCKSIEEGLKSAASPKQQVSIEDLLTELRLLVDEWPSRRQRLL